MNGNFLFLMPAICVRWEKYEANEKKSKACFDFFVII